jgi:hypothetical protein
MGQFGDIINHPLSLIVIHTDLFLVDPPIAGARDIAAMFNPEVVVYKVNTSVNEELCRLLRLKSNITYLIYSNKELIERIEGFTDTKTLKNKLINHLKTLKII